MLKLWTLEEALASDWPRGHWYELAPGPDNGRMFTADAGFVRMAEWEGILEPLLAERIPGYDRHGRANAEADAWRPAVDYLGEVAERLRSADEPAMLHVLLPEVPASLRWELARGFPSRPAELAADLEACVAWIDAALRRWKSLTIIGL